MLKLIRKTLNYKAKRYHEATHTADSVVAVKPLKQQQYNVIIMWRRPD